MAGVINTFQVTFLEVTPRMAALVFLFRCDFRRSVCHQFQCLDVRAGEIFESEVGYLLSFFGLLYHLCPTGFGMPHHEVVYRQLRRLHVHPHGGEDRFRIACSCDAV